MYYQIILVIHVLLGLSVIGLVVMQHGKGADAGAAFGSGSSGSVFGARGAATFLSKTTAIFASLFFLTSLGLTWLSGYQAKPADIMDMPAAQEEVKPDVPLVDFNDDEGVAADSVPSASDSAQPMINEAVDAAIDAGDPAPSAPLEDIDGGNNAAETEQLPAE